ncbi:MAG: DUF5050 domain-containing protein [Oscillospiraceae bacterium]|nr:DUF5050 domain-containing protein [Oscillospiraceae bacterium]
MKKLLLCVALSFALFPSCSEAAPIEEESTTEENIYFNIEVLYFPEPDASYKYTYDKEDKIIYFLDESGNIYKTDEDGGDKEMIFSAKRYDYVFVDNIYYYDSFIYFLERDTKAKGFYRINPNDGNLSKIEIDEELFGPYNSIDQYIIYDNELYLVKGYWGGIWKVNLESLELTYYGDIWGNFCFDTEYLYILSGRAIYKIHKEKKYDENDGIETIDTTFIPKHNSGISRIYLSNEKIFYDVYTLTDDTHTDNPYRYDLYCSNKDGSEIKKIATGNEFGGILFEKSGYLYFIERTNGYLYRISSGDETIEQVRKINMRNYNRYVIGDYLYLEERKKNDEPNVMRVNISENTNEFTLERINWLMAK